MIRYFMTLMLIALSSQAWAMGNVPLSAVTDSLIGKPPPEFTLEKVSGTQQSLTQARDGKKAVIFFWATWCPHCHEELGKIIKNKGIQIILVDVGEAKEDVKAYLDHRKLPWNSFLDEDNTVAGQYGIEGIPTLFFIDEKGIVRTVEHEFPNDYETLFHSSAH